VDATNAHLGEIPRFSKAFQDRTLEETPPPLESNLKCLWTSSREGVDTECSRFVNVRIVNIRGDLPKSFSPCGREISSVSRVLSGGSLGKQRKRPKRVACMSHMNVPIGNQKVRRTGARSSILDGNAKIQFLLVCIRLQLSGVLSGFYRRGWSQLAYCSVAIDENWAMFGSVSHRPDG
jgi:hypothetical protein